MIIRAPTRTMTKSFNGKQMGGFKFPSVENQPAEPLDEYHLNNHHLLNENVVVKSHQKITTDEDGVSQIQSDYTSASNANTNSGNSSNGYYSFANISDNTTSMPSKTQSYTSSPGSFGSGDGGKPSELTVPREDQHNHASQKSLEPMEVIPEDNGNGYTSASLNVPSILTADNFSFDIASSRSLKPRSTTKKVDSAASLVNSPSLDSSRSSALTASRSNSSLSTKISQPKSRSQLKRSGSIRCRGGLLQYFTRLSTRIKRTLRKIRMALRWKNSKSNIPPSTNVNSNAPRFANKPRANVTRVSSKKELTSHLNRTNGYVSNLQRSVSQRSLHPLQQESNATPNFSSNRPSPDGSTSDFVTPPGSRIVRNPTTPLRRTPSSIRRAASVIRTPIPPGPPVAALSDGFLCEDAVVGRVSSFESSKAGVVRSNGSKSLNSLARQRSIVVKNKVIPLSMHQYSIREEDEDKYSHSQFIIKSSSRYSLSPLEKISSENSVAIEDEPQSGNSSFSGISLGDYTDAYEHVDLDSDSFDSDFSIEPSQSAVHSFVQSENEYVAYPADSLESYGSSESIDSTILDQEVQDFTANLKQFFKCVISQRIKLRLQLSHHQSFHPTSSSYLDLIESLLGDYESESAASYSPGGSVVPIGTINEENSKVQPDEVVPLFCETERDTIRINVQSGYCRRGNSKRSMISLRSKDVKRSLTLPISMKV